MINRNDQHVRQTLEQTEQPTGPVKFEQLLDVAALLGVPVMRCHRGRLEVHEPPEDGLGSRPVGPPKPEPRERAHALGSADLLPSSAEPKRITAVLAQAPREAARPRPGSLSPISPANAPDGPGSPRTEPDPARLERTLTDLERSRKALRRRIRRG